MPNHLTWSRADFDPLGAALPEGVILPGRPLTFQVTGCFDCDWRTRTATYFEAVDACLEHVAHMSVVPLPLAVPAMPTERRWVA